MFGFFNICVCTLWFFNVCVSVCVGIVKFSCFNVVGFTMCVCVCLSVCMCVCWVF